jgi:integrase
MKNSNHPQKGSHITVDPIRNEKDIQRIKKSLRSNSRDSLLFSLGINNGLRISDLLNIRVGQVRDLKAGDSLTIREQKTGKENVLMINKGVYSTLQDHLASKDWSDDDYLFQSRKGQNKPLTVPSVHRMVQEWTYGMKGNYGTHSLRKTFGYIQRTKFGVSFEVLCRRFNHSNPSTTMRYLGIHSKEVNDILMNEI